MLKSVLVLLDETPSSASARKFAFRLAQNTGAALTGLAGIDLTFIEAPMLGGVGTSSIKVRLEEKLQEAGRRRAPASARSLRNGVQGSQPSL